MYISIDMGATNTRVAFTTNLENSYDLSEYIKFKTSPNLQAQKQLLLKTIKKFSKDNIKAVCFSAPGTIDYKTNHFIDVPNYKEMQNLPTNYFFDDPMFENALFIAVNDANSASYAESLLGAGKDYNKVLYLSIGTGLGGSLIENKSIKDVYKNFEPGHEIIFSDMLDFEDHCSGSAFNRIYKDKNNKDNWIQYAKDLNKGLLYLNKKYKPDVFVFGGGFAASHFKDFNKLLIDNLNIKQCAFKDGSGIIGGFQIIKVLLDNKN